MGQRLATLILLTTPLGGCSLIYGPDRLPQLADAPPADANPPGLTIERVAPSVIFEGQGDGGSRSALLVIYGSNILPGATVSIDPHPGEPRRPSLFIDNANAVVDIYSQMIAVPIKVDVDANIGPTTPIPSLRLDVTVTQPAPYGDIRATLGGDAPALTLQGLPELTGTPGALPANAPVTYSQVDVTTLSAAAARKEPLIIRSTSSITIRGPGTIALNATGQTAGPGGFDGGDGGPPGLIGTASDGKTGGGMGGGRPNGGGAGFASTGGNGNGTGGSMVGDAALTSLDSPNRGSGGAGGRGATIATGSDGGDGGGGGGSLELTAAGDLTIMVPIEAKGADGGPSNGSATPGGGGAGGVVLLRAGGNLTMASGSVTATGGQGGSGSTGRGSEGRVRVDSPQGVALTISSMPAVGYRGPMFPKATPMVVREARPKITFIGQPDALIKYTIQDADSSTLGPVEIMVSNTGEITVPLAMPLFPGFNRLCALVTGVTKRVPEAENCITIAYQR